MDLEVRSAGIAPHPGLRAAGPAVAVLAEEGIDISDEFSKSVTIENLTWADLIVPMCRNQAVHLLEDFPELASKVRVLERDVADPYGKPIEPYRDVRDELHELLTRFVQVLHAQRE
jgi:protein-tyrosine-phosphatase